MSETGREPKFRKVGHACFLMESEGQRILFDPWFGTPINYGTFHAFPKMVPPTPEEIASLVAIHISHIHDDHFDKPSLSQLPRHIPILIAKYKNPRFREEIMALGFSKIIELDPGAKDFQIGPFSLTVFPKLPDDGTFDSSAVLGVNGKYYYVANDCFHPDFTYSQMLRIFGSFEGGFVGYTSINPPLFCTDLSECRDHVLRSEQKVETVRVAQDPVWRHVQRVTQLLKLSWVSPYSSDFRFLNSDLAHHNSNFVSPLEVFTLDLGSTKPVVLDPGQNFGGRADEKTGSTAHLSKFELLECDLIPSWLEANCPEVELGAVVEKTKSYFTDVFRAQQRQWVLPMTIDLEISNRGEREKLRFKCRGETVAVAAVDVNDNNSDMIVEYPAAALSEMFRGRWSLRSFHTLYLHKVRILRTQYGQMSVMPWA